MARGADFPLEQRAVGLLRRLCKCGQVPTHCDSNESAAIRRAARWLLVRGYARRDAGGVYHATECGRAWLAAARAARDGTGPDDAA